MKAALLSIALASVIGSPAFMSKDHDSYASHLERHNFATCKPSAKGACNACKNCKYCKHCSEKGGTCTVCKPPKKN